MTGKGFRQYSLSTVVSLATAAGGTIPSGATEVTIQPENGNIRVRDDGTGPSASSGLIVYAGTALTIDGGLGFVGLIAASSTITVNMSFRGP